MASSTTARHGCGPRAGWAERQTRTALSIRPWHRHNPPLPSRRTPHGRFIRAEQGQLERPRRPACGLPRVPGAAVHRHGRAPVRRGALRPSSPRRYQRAAGGSPAMPHRHRHPVTGAPGRRAYRLGLFRCVAGAGAAVGQCLQPTYPLRRGPGLRRCAGARRAALRPGLHGHRRAQLAATHRRLGRQRGRAAQAGWATLPARGAPRSAEPRRDLRR